jgi:transposase
MRIKPLIDDLTFDALFAYRAFDANWLRMDIIERGAQAVIPPQKASQNPNRLLNRQKQCWWNLIVDIRRTDLADTVQLATLPSFFAVENFE